MDFDNVITLIERVGFIGTMLIAGAFLFWQAQKQSSKRDASNAVLHKGHLDIQLQQTLILSRLTDNVENNQNSIKEQSEKINGKLDIIPDHVTETADRVTAELARKMDTQHGKVMELLNPVKSIQDMLNELKANHETQNALHEKQNTIMQHIESELPNLKKDVIAGIEKIVKEESKANELQKIPIVNPNHNGADG